MTKQVIQTFKPRVVHHREGPIPRDGGPGISLLVTGTGESHRPVVGELVSDSIERQTEQTIDNTAAILEADGAFLSDVVKVNTHLSDLGLFARYNTVYARRFLRPFPARTTVGSDLSHSPGMLIEMDCVAYSVKKTGSKPANTAKKKVGRRSK